MVKWETGRDATNSRPSAKPAGCTRIGASCTAPPGLSSERRAPGKGLTVRLVDSVPELGGLEPTWRRLEDAQGVVNPFLTWEWQWSWWEVFQGAALPRVLLFSDDRGPAAVVPLCAPRADPSRLVFAGGDELSDQLGYLSCPGLAEEVADLTLRWARSSGARRLDLQFLTGWGQELPALEGAAQELGLPHLATPQEVSPGLDLPSDFEAYLSQRLGKKDRHELRRKLRRLDQEAPGWKLLGPGDLGLEPALDRFLWLLRESRPDKAAFLTPEVDRFFRLVAGRLAARGWLRLWLLEARGELIAGTFGFCTGGVWYLYNSGYDPGRAHLSPGLICVAEGLRRAMQEGCRQADLLRGNEAYKYRLGAEDQVLLRLAVSLDGSPA